MITQKGKPFLSPTITQEINHISTKDEKIARQNIK